MHSFLTSRNLKIPETHKKRFLRIVFLLTNYKPQEKYRTRLVYEPTLLHSSKNTCSHDFHIFHSTKTHETRKLASISSLKPKVASIYAFLILYNTEPSKKTNHVLYTTRFLNFTPPKNTSYITNTRFMHVFLIIRPNKARETDKLRV